MAKNLVAQVSKAGGDFELREREIPQPGVGEVRVKVQACGICFSDHLTKDGLWPGLTYPRIPGHEVAGVVDEVGAHVTEWKKGDRVGVGWHGGHCFVCASCRRGDFVTCQREEITGITRDGGYQQYMIARHEGLALMPEGLDPADAGPLMCAGITTFNSLRNSGARAGDVVAVQGIGGLGHLGIQYAAKAGYYVVGIGRGPENAALAKKLGAAVYIDSKATNAAQELQKLGGAKVILSTAPNSKAMSDVIDGLGVGGKLLVVGAAPEPIAGIALPGHWRAQGNSGLAFGIGDGLGGHVAVFSADGCTRDDREISLGEGEGSVRTDGKWACAVSRGPNNGIIGCLITAIRYRVSGTK